MSVPTRSWRSQHFPNDMLLPDAPFDLLARAVLVCKRGSEAHNTYVPSTDPDSIDDRDVLVVCVPPPEHYFGLGEYFELARWEQVQGIRGVWDVAAYELRKFVHMLCRQNPNALQALWLRSQDYYGVGLVGGNLIAVRRMFQARRPFYEATVGYARAQLRKMTSGEGDPRRGFMGAKRKALREKFGYDTKNAAHMVRVLETGAEFLRTGEMTVYRPEPSAARLRAIKRGEWSLDQVLDFGRELFWEAECAFNGSTMPLEVDRAAVNRWLSAQIGWYLNSEKWS